AAFRTVFFAAAALRVGDFLAAAFFAVLRFAAFLPTSVVTDFFAVVFLGAAFFAAVFFAPRADVRAAREGVDTRRLSFWSIAGAGADGNTGGASSAGSDRPGLTDRPAPRYVSAWTPAHRAGRRSTPSPLWDAHRGAAPGRHPPPAGPRSGL